MREITIDDVRIRLSSPDELDMRWVGQQEILFQLLAAWLVVDAADLPLNPRLIGKPGVGKTTLAYAAARSLGQPVYLFQATMDTRPEDLIITPIIQSHGQIGYAASPLVSAMVAGGVCIIDEGNRMSEKSWASLAPLLDHRRYVESLVAGIKIKAHEKFRICVTMNEDASTYDIPEYIHSRLQPQIALEFPEPAEELAILSQNLPFADVAILHYVVDFLQRAHRAEERYSVRDGINVARYALKRLASAPGAEGVSVYLKEAILLILGKDALLYAE